MSEILHREEAFRQRQVDRLVDGLEKLYNNATDNWVSFKELAKRDLPDAIRRLPEFIGAARDVNPNRTLAEAYGGGPNHDWIIPLLNVLGDCYAGLDKESRTAILRHCLNYFDGLRYDYSQNHVEGIESPLLVADIIVNRGLYWPGLDQPKRFLAGKSVEQLASEPRERMESFWIALRIIYNGDCGTLPIRQWYYKHYPQMVDGAISYLGPVFADAAEEAVQREGGEWKEQVQNRLNKYIDPLLHECIWAKIEEKSWIVLPK